MNFKDILESLKSLTSSELRILKESIDTKVTPSVTGKDSVESSYPQLLIPPHMLTMYTENLFLSFLTNYFRHFKLDYKPSVGLTDNNSIVLVTYANRTDPKYGQFPRVVVQGLSMSSGAVSVGDTPDYTKPSKVIGNYIKQSTPQTSVVSGGIRFWIQAANYNECNILGNHVFSAVMMFKKYLTAAFMFNSIGWPSFNPASKYKEWGEAYLSTVDISYQLHYYWDMIDYNPIYRDILLVLCAKLQKDTEVPIVETLGLYDSSDYFLRNLVSKCQ